VVLAAAAFALAPLAPGVSPAGAQAEGTTSTAPGTPVGAGGQPRADAVAAGIADEGWYGDPVAGAEIAAWDDLAAALGRQDSPIAFALLDAEPLGGSTVYAELVLDALPARGGTRYDTVVVLSPDDVGVVSDDWGDDAIDAALDESLDDLRADPARGLSTLADELAERPLSWEESGDDGDDGSGSGSSTGWLVLGGLAVGAVVLYRASQAGSADGGDDDGSSWGGSSSYRRRRAYGVRARRSARSSSRRSTSRRSSSRRSSGRGRGGRRL
jgi:hypothetical protein